jgi:hypothetical protein
MKCNYSISFEFETTHPITEKGTARGTSARTVAARAIDDAVEKNPNLNWRSIVIVLERENPENEKKGLDTGPKV